VIDVKVVRDKVFFVECGCRGEKASFEQIIEAINGKCLILFGGRRIKKIIKEYFLISVIGWYQVPPFLIWSRRFQWEGKLGGVLESIMIKWQLS
jgi:hypothetical protein